MSPFRAKPGYSYKIKVKLPDGRSGTFTTGTRDLALAKAVDQFITKLFRQRQWEVLESLVGKRVKLPDLFDRYERDGMDGVITLIADVNETDLSPLVDALLDDEKYRAQVRRFIPVGVRFPASRFTRAAVSSFLAGLTDQKAHEERPVSANTRDRYKAALSVFADTLIEKDLLDANPTRDIARRRRRGERREHTIPFLEPENVEKLVSAIPPGQFQALEALMSGAGMEWGAAIRLVPEDIDFDTRIVLAKGTKNKYRTRYLEVTEDWAWDLFSSYAKQVPPKTKLFTMTPDQALRIHANASTAVGIHYTTLHQHRHSYAVMWIKRGVAGMRTDGRDIQWLKNQLGHAPQSNLLFDRYGVYINAAKLTAAQKSRQPGAGVIPITKKKRA